MNRETYADSRLLTLERPHQERRYRTLEALEFLLDQRMTALEGRFEQHLAEHHSHGQELRSPGVADGDARDREKDPAGKVPIGT